MDPDEKLEAAQLLVSEYGRVLEEHAAYMLKPQEALPTTKEEIKWALLIMAAWGKMTGQITAKSLEQLRMGFASLADFVPAAEARVDQHFSDLVRKGPQRDDWSAEEIQQVAKDIAGSGFSPERRQQANAEFQRLIEEFDQTLSILVEKVTGAQE